MATILEALQSQSPRAVIEVMNIRHGAIRNAVPEIVREEALTSELMGHAAYIRVGRRVRQKEAGKLIL